MIIISDTSCLSALFRIGEIFILEQLFGEITIPPKVMSELENLSKFGYDSSFFSQAEWIKVATPQNLSLFNNLRQTLDEGESEAIALAFENPQSLLIIDEINGRLAAKQLNLNITGLGGVLIQAKNKKIISEVKIYLDRVRSEAKFRINESIYQQILSAANE